jgi:ectoine hydroxylase-related dioxygenase (phytanoyl-CoA dioxygenase family)
MGEKKKFDVPAYFSDQDINVRDFAGICRQKTHIADYPFAAAVEKDILIYEGDRIRQTFKDPMQEASLKAELCQVLKDGPGVFAVRNAYPDKSVIDRSTAVFLDIIAQEKASGLGQGDHFGDNERIWNSIQKACVKEPDLFIDYYGNPILAMACQAWLGPFYQISAQVNNVKPNSEAQSAHRDYHLGFQSVETVARFPAHAQVMSQFLTLQGAVAHCDMPVESGPTMLLPFSHQYAVGYLAYTRSEFRAYFEAHKVQLSFEKGDMVFLSPALFHGAGTNTSSSDRIANLLQISSAFGRTMETINHGVMVEAVYPALLARVLAGRIGEREIYDTIAAVAEGYSFPTNLDFDPPMGGNAPETGQQLLHRALLEKWPIDQFKVVMGAYAERRGA